MPGEEGLWARRTCQDSPPDPTTQHPVEGRPKRGILETGRLGGEQQAAGGHQEATRTEASPQQEDEASPLKTRPESTHPVPRAGP